MRAEAGKATPAGIVMVLHDANLARRWCDRALLLFGDGAWVEGPVAEVVNFENVSRLYGHLFRAIDDGGEAWFVPT
jgi:iron complex transport system ATP-binding protein